MPPRFFWDQIPQSFNQIPPLSFLHKPIPKKFKICQHPFIGSFTKCLPSWQEGRHTIRPNVMVAQKAMSRRWQRQSIIVATKLANSNNDYEGGIGSPMGGKLLGNIKTKILNVDCRSIFPSNEVLNILLESPSKCVFCSIKMSANSKK